MTFTYTNKPNTVTRDEVRFLIGDTDNTDPIVTDEEISYAIAQEATTKGAAARIAESVSALFARKVDKSVGDLRISLSQRYKHYMELAAKLRRDADVVAAAPYAGGISIDDKDTVEEDTDRVRPHFEVGLHDNIKTTDTAKGRRRDF